MTYAVGIDLRDFVRTHIKKTREMDLVSVEEIFSDLWGYPTLENFLALRQWSLCR